MNNKEFQDSSSESRILKCRTPLLVEKLMTPFVVFLPKNSGLRVLFNDCYSLYF